MLLVRKPHCEKHRYGIYLIRETKDVNAQGKENIWELFFLKSLHVLGSSFTCFSIRSTVACTVFLKPKSSLGHQTTSLQKITDLCDPVYGRV